MKITQHEEEFTPLMELLMELDPEKLDHWQFLDLMSSELFDAAKATKNFCESIEHISQNRAKLLKALGKVRVLSTLLVFNLSMHMSDFGDEVEKNIQEMIKQLEELQPSEENYDDMEF